MNSLQILESSLRTLQPGKKLLVQSISGNIVEIFYDHDGDYITYLSNDTRHVNFVEDNDSITRIIRNCHPILLIKLLNQNGTQRILYNGFRYLPIPRQRRN